MRKIALLILLFLGVSCGEEKKDIISEINTAKEQYSHFDLVLSTNKYKTKIGDTLKIYYNIKKLISDKDQFDLIFKINKKAILLNNNIRIIPEKKFIPNFLNDYITFISKEKGDFEMKFLLTGFND